MRCVSRVVAAVLPVLLLQATTGLSPVLSARVPHSNEQAERTRPDGPGRLTGVVTDTAGTPVEETLVSATGPAGVSLAVCDADGRFEFQNLRPGTYLLRAHMAGLDAAQRSIVEVRPGLATVHSVTLRRRAVASPSPAFLAAGFGGIGRTRATPDEFGVSGQPDDVSAETEIDETTSGDVVAPHDDSEKAWRLRRARRSVLKDSDVALVRAGDPLGGSLIAMTPRLAADRTMGDVSSTFPVSGQLHLLTRATLHSSSELWSTDILPGQIAYASVGGPEQDSRWRLRGAMRTGDAGSWALAGTFVAEASETRALAVGLSYSRQQLGASLAEDSLTPSAAVLHTASTPDSSREVGTVSVEGSWVASPHVTLDYGANVARYGYLPTNGLVSPNAMITIEPLSRTRVRVGVAQNMLAPGAEEFLPPSDGVWLPPERTFALLSPTDPLSAERSQHLEVSVERDLGRTSTVGVRRFYQDVDDQMVALFGVRPQNPISSADHYYLTSASGVSAEGWGVMFSHTLAGRVRGAVDYSLTDAEWAPWMASGLSPQSVGVFRTGTERFHDVTTSVETEITETATEVFVLYRISSAFAVLDSDTDALTSGLDGRFALRVKQTLPFSPFEGSDWEVLVDIRSLFRERVAGASVYDELLVASPPKQVVGGLVVHF